MYILAAAIAVYGVIGAVMFVVQRQLLYYPSGLATTAEQRAETGYKAMPATAADGIEVVSWFRPPPGPEAPTIVVFHGNGGSADGRIGKYWPFVDAGFGVLLAEYRGYGGNAGRPKETGLKQDAAALLEVLEGQGIAPCRTVLYGESLGSGLAVPMAGVGPYAGLIVEGGFSRLADVAQSHYPWLPVRPLLRDRYDNIAHATALAMPILVVHSERDEVVPLRFAQRLFEAAAEPKDLLMVSGAGHNDVYTPDVWNEVLAFASAAARDADC